MRILECGEKYSTCKGQTVLTHILAWKYYLEKKQHTHTKNRRAINLPSISELLLATHTYIFSFEPFLAKGSSEQLLLGLTAKQIILIYWKSVKLEKFITGIHKIFLCTSSPAAVVSYSRSNSQPLIDTYFSTRQNPKSEIYVLLEWICLGIVPHFLIHCQRHMQVMIRVDSWLVGRQE